MKKVLRIAFDAAFLVALGAGLYYGGRYLHRHGYVTLGDRALVLGARPETIEAVTLDGATWSATGETLTVDEAARVATWSDPALPAVRVRVLLTSIVGVKVRDKR